jgi:hypothetical protein
MDEMWQRHKSFILQLIAGGIVFLVLFMVMRSNYGDVNDPSRIESQNKGTKDELEEKSRKGKAPSSSTIAEQKAVADKGAAAKHALIERVASFGGRDDQAKNADREKAYVRESITATLAVLGKKYDDQWMDMYSRQPQTCLSAIHAEARTALVGRAAQSGKEIDELLGLGAGFQSDEIPEVLQGFAIQTDVVSRLLSKPGVARINNLRITPHSGFAEANGISFMAGVGIHMDVVGDPTDIYEVVRSFNAPDRRMVVVESIEGVSPVSPDEDEVKATLNLVGLRYTQAKEGE